MQNHYKYPKIFHFPWSLSKTKDDKTLSIEQIDQFFAGKDVVVTEKLDGENTTLYNDYLHARSLESKSHPSRTWIKNFHSQIKYSIPESWRISGENMYAKHSIHYQNLFSYFYVFSIFNQSNTCISWKDTIKWCQDLWLQPVPVLYEGKFDIERIKKCWTGKSVFTDSEQEGYVMRLQEAFSFEDLQSSYAKFVRKNHVQTDENWMYKKVIPNKLAKG